MRMAAIQLVLTGQQRVAAGLARTRMEVMKFANSADYLGRHLERAGRRSFLVNQALFTLRRYAYMGTLAITAMGAAALKWGYDYNVQVQNATVALRMFLPTQQAVNDEIAFLYGQIAAPSPFAFQDIVVAARRFMAFGMTLEQTNTTIVSITDALSAMGLTSGAALNRASLALGHMMSLGRLTGLTVFQLARDNIPMVQALEKEFGLTGEQLRHVGNLGITANQALQALNNYIASSAYHGAARRLGLSTVQGLLSTARDYMAQVFGELEKKQFASLQRIGTRTVNFLTGAGARGLHEGGIRGFLGAINPNVLRVWELLAAIWHNIGRIITGSLIPAFREVFRYTGPVLYAAAASLVWIFGILSRRTWLLRGFFMLMAVALSFLALKLMVSAFWAGVLAVREALLWARTTILTGAFIFKTVAVEADTVATEGNTVASAEGQLVLTRFGRTLLIFGQRLLYTRAGIWLWATAIRGAAAATGIWTVLTTGAARTATGQFRAMTRLEKVAMRMRVAFLALSRAVRVYSIALLSAARVGIVFLFTNPIGWAILLIGTLIILYFKWKWFHNLVNDTFDWIRAHWVLLGTILIGPFFLFGVAVWKIFDRVKTIVAGVYNWMVDKITWVTRHIHRLLSWLGFGGGVGNAHGTPTPGGAGPTGMPFGQMLPTISSTPMYAGAAEGGFVNRGGMGWVGERGPELMSLPRGASITPVPAHQRLNMGDIGGPKELYATTILQVDGLELAKVVTKHQMNAEARR